MGRTEKWEEVLQTLGYEGERTLEPNRDGVKIERVGIRAIPVSFKGDGSSPIVNFRFCVSGNLSVFFGKSHVVTFSHVLRRMGTVVRYIPFEFAAISLGTIDQRVLFSFSKVAFALLEIKHWYMENLLFKWIVASSLAKIK